MGCFSFPTWPAIFPLMADLSFSAFFPLQKYSACSVWQNGYPWYCDSFHLWSFRPFIQMLPVFSRLTEFNSSPFWKNRTLSRYYLVCLGHSWLLDLHLSLFSYSQKAIWKSPFSLWGYWHLFRFLHALTSLMSCSFWSKIKSPSCSGLHGCPHYTCFPLVHYWHIIMEE